MPVQREESEREGGNEKEGEEGKVHTAALFSPLLALGTHPRVTHYTPDAINGVHRGYSAVRLVMMFVQVAMSRCGR